MLDFSFKQTHNFSHISIIKLQVVKKTNLYELKIMINSISFKREFYISIDVYCIGFRVYIRSTIVFAYLRRFESSCEQPVSAKCFNW